MSLRHAMKGAERAHHIRRYMKRTGLTPWGQKLWTKTEDDKIIRLYPDIKMLRRRLKLRSVAAIQQRAGTLGVRGKRYVWKSSEIIKLRKLYLTAHWMDILDAFPGLSKQQIKNCAVYHGMKRDKKRFRKTGISVLDEIREKAYQMNLTMADLDYMAGTKHYFTRAPWCNKSRQPNKKALWNAIEALGGKISVEWE